MKILLTVDPEIPVPPLHYGGIERIVDLLVNDYVRKGHNVTLIAHPESSVPCNHIKWKGFRSQHPIDLIRNTFILTKTVIKNDFDIIHSFSRLAYMLPIMPFSIAKVMSYQREPSLKQIYRASKLSKKSSLAFTGCSNYITNKIRKVTSASTIYNCVQHERYSFQAKVDDDAPLFFLGRMEDIKGPHIAIEVANQTNRRLILAGNISEDKADFFKERIEPFLNERIQYIGPVNDYQKNELLGKAIALLMPVLWNEPFGIVMAEAMICGTPVLGFSLGSVSEIVQDGLNGFICANTGDMVKKVAIVCNIERRKVREIALEKFSDKSIPDQYLALYSSMIK